jgi:hypothetical protein
MLNNTEIDIKFLQARILSLNNIITSLEHETERLREFVRDIQDIADSMKGHKDARFWREDIMFALAKVTNATQQGKKWT